MGRTAIKRKMEPGIQFQLSCYTASTNHKEGVEMRKGKARGTLLPDLQLLLSYPHPLTLKSVLSCSSMLAAYLNNSTLETLEIHEERSTT